jgi:ubiquinone/menaquinone biosynthesis C-methylase UbiE
MYDTLHINCQQSFFEAVKTHISNLKTDISVSVNEVEERTTEHPFSVLWTSVSTEEKLDEKITSLYDSELSEGCHQACLVQVNGATEGQVQAHLLTFEKQLLPIKNSGDVVSTAVELIISYYKASRKFQIVRGISTGSIAGAKEFSDLCKHLSLFTLFTASKSGEIGAIAKRDNKGFLVTGRSMNNSALNYDNVTLMQEKEQYDVVSSKSVLPSRYSSMLVSALQQRKDANIAVYSPLKNFPHSVTVQMTESGIDLAQAKDSEIVILPANLGSIILLKSETKKEAETELANILLKNSVYESELAPFYDVAYSRFQYNSRLKQYLLGHIGENYDAQVLDLCGGTGIFTDELLGLGYRGISIADASEFMLSAAKRKLERKYKNLMKEENYIQVRMESLNERINAPTFDAIVIRQAVNYLPPKSLVQAFSGIREALLPGGKFIFNSFIYSKDHSPVTRCIRHDNTTNVLITRENTMILTSEGEEVGCSFHYHSQQTDIFDSVTGSHVVIYDLNRFHIHTPEQYIEALKQAGFSNVQYDSFKSSCYLISTK